ncbi:hypothetical protein CLIB1444_05S02168 [[Candida] jaroonii]|uniref:Uncharacterized protein n=1 Tax=[Candida] jaroonii TaxID=467808 RepID=A0ACA9Y8K1_9ASCO|nr:hypothetical protein CLIB1444_05S02168 [[Candida] jaroonii]
MEDTSLSRFTKAIRSGNQYNIKNIGTPKSKSVSIKVKSKGTQVNSKGLSTPPETPKEPSSLSPQTPEKPSRTKCESIKKSETEVPDLSREIVSNQKSINTHQMTQLNIEILKQQMTELNYELLINFTQLRDKLDYLNEKINYFKQSNDELLITKVEEIEKSNQQARGEQTQTLGFFITTTCLMTPLAVCAIILYREIHQHV